MIEVLEESKENIVATQGKRKIDRSRLSGAIYECRSEIFKPGAEGAGEKLGKRLKSIFLWMFKFQIF